MADVKIKLFGERNTGTRAVLRILDDTPGLLSAAATPDHVERDAAMRFDVKQTTKNMSRPWRRVYREAIKDQSFEDAGPLRIWKHAAPVYTADFAATGARVLFLVRNPYSWVIALHKKPYHMLGDAPDHLVDFVTQPWLTVTRDQTKRLLRSPVELWNIKLAAYRDFAARAAEDGVMTTVMTFEDFVASPKPAFSAAMKRLDIDCPDPVYDPRPTKRFGLSLRSRRRFYQKESWRKDLTEAAKHEIDARIDWALAAHFGYHPGA